MQRMVAVILAAGQGTRMKSQKPKVLHPVAGLPMIHYPLNLLDKLGVARTIIVVGHQKEEVRKALEGRKVEIVSQAEQLGTGHAVLQVKPILSRSRGTILILCGDTPLLTAGTVGQLIKTHKGQNADVTLLTTTVPDPRGYGRIVRDDEGRVTRIVEERDASPVERQIQEINTGVYCFDASFLFEALEKVKNDNAKKEYYLTDVVKIAVDQRKAVASVFATNAEETEGINNRIDLARAERVVRRRIIETLMLEGVTVIDPDSTYIDATVTIGPDTTVYPGATLEGRTTIGRNCLIGPHVRIADSTIADAAAVRDSTVVVGSQVGRGAVVGPFAHLRPGSVLMEDVRVGNYVEVKKTTLGAGTKANHLSYLGDATIGKRVNIGAGTITCNYDGRKKHPTTIEDEAFIGSDTQFIAPVTVGRGALVAAGTTVTDDVPPRALAISRVPQMNREEYVKARREGKIASGKKPPARRKPVEFDEIAEMPLIGKFERFAVSYEEAFFSKFKELLAREIPEARMERLEEFVAFVRRLSSVYQALSLPDLLRRILDETRFLHWVQSAPTKRSGAETEAWMDEVKSLLSLADRRL
ncbi:MAG: UDP-N-acetylglucosamine diphosphorylase/glucosamine-1-phosphate N-acetyltransferase [Nitrospirae bacterium RBG_16_64_22]|nr:MAG: UDP-N-acetylglucosamine diphosphorylase/glucosamine-1-phosphate N-acetyltransferase [Nitrospirae bacterium RBG_16_64_22]